MPAQKIDRIALPAAEQFFTQYVLQRKPVIITNLFDGQPIASIKTLADARRVFHDVPLQVRTEYSTAMATRQEAVQVMSFGDYWDFVDANPSTAMMCTVYEIPAAIMSQFTLPSVCLGRNISDEEILAMPRKYGDHDLLLNAFVGNRGNKAHLHFDGDHRQVLLYQVFGTKTVVLFQPESGAALRLLDLVPGFAGVSLESMTESERATLVDAADGYMDTLQPGEAIYMPMLIWHYLEYNEHAMSFNVRFGRNRYGRFLCVDNFHRDYYVQNVASRLADLDRCACEYKEGLDSVVQEYQRPAELADKVRAMRTLFRGLCDTMCPEAGAREYCPPEREDGEVSKILESSKNTLRYADVATVSRMRPTGPLSGVQRSHIENRAKANGYSPTLFAHLLRNRLGKERLESLTKAEAAQFLAYMSTPGARVA